MASVPQVPSAIAAPRLFLAAPFRQWIDPATGEVVRPSRAGLTKLHRAFVDQGFSVFSAHERETWGRDLMEPHVCTELDFEEMRRADVVCAIVGAPASAGVCVEIGWASCMRKPMVLVLPASEECSALLEGLGAVTDVTVLRSDRLWIARTRRSVVEAVNLLRPKGEALGS